jgi:hypothetical protein
VGQLLGEERADHAEVGHHGDAPAGVAGPERGEARAGAPGELAARLSIARARRSVAGVEERERLGIARRDLAAGEPRPAPEVELPQAPAGKRVDPERARQRGAGLDRPREIAGDDELEAERSELARQGRRLLAPVRRERRIAVALPAPVGVPRRLRVADERQIPRFAQDPIPSSRRPRAPSFAPSQRSRPGARRFA